MLVSACIEGVVDRTLKTAGVCHICNGKQNRDCDKKMIMAYNAPSPPYGKHKGNAIAMYEGVVEVLAARHRRPTRLDTRHSPAHNS